MVVTRRTPTTPMPPTSRTNSSQSTPRTSSLNKGKSPQKSSLLSTDNSSLANGDNDQDDSASSGQHSGPQFSDDVVFSDGSPSPKKYTAKGKSKSKAKKGLKEKKLERKRSTSFVDLLSRMFILCFIIYSLSVCPSDTHLQSPVCRALSEYRRLVLEPYIIPPIRNAFSHPAVAPYIAHVKPYYNTAVKAATPAVNRTRKEWNKRVVPQWNKRIVPQWRKRVVPRLRVLDAHVEPYRRRIGLEYAQRVAPYVRQTQRWARRAQPHVLYAAAKTYDRYRAAQPYAARVGLQLRRLPPLFVRYIAAPFAAARRQLVDPHVARMLEKATELSRGRPRPSPVGESGGAKEITLPPVSSTVTVDSAKTLTAEIVLPSVPKPTDDAAQSAASLISASISVDDLTTSESATRVVSSSPESASSVLSDGFVQSLSSVSSVLSKATETASGLSTSASSAIASALESTSSVPQPPVKTDVDPATETSAAVPSTTPFAAVPSILSDDTTEIDLDAFYADLELDLDPDLNSTSPFEEPPRSVEPEESEEEKAERRALKARQTAEKRQDIEARHAKWEDELQRTVKAQRKSLRKALVALRKDAAAALAASPEIRAEVETLHGEAEKALRGTEAYFAKLRKEQNADGEKVRLWDRVLGKVEEKFAARVNGVEKVVDAWYAGVLQNEMLEVETTAAMVKSIADDGQADIGLDYAWLDDVTYMDWRRYHALLDVYSQFLDQALSIQNGTHPSPPINPVISALEDLQSELQDIVVGFETRLRRVKREGERAFASGGPAEKLDMDFDDAHDAAEPEVSILPVPEAGAEEGHTESDAPFLMGRGRDEIFGALERAGEAGKVKTASLTAATDGADISIEEPVVVAQGEEGRAEVRDPEVLHEEL